MYRPMLNRPMRYLAGLGLVAAVATIEAAPLAAQEASGDTATVYKREVFSYQRAGRSDPFRSLLDGADLGVRFEDLALQGIMYHPDPRRSVAILSQRGSSRRIQAKVGERIGGLTVVAIRPRAVDIIIEEFGVARRETMELNSAPKGGIE